MPNLVLRFDMRNPPIAGPAVDKAELYKAAIEMAVWADRNGFHTVQFSEHHGSDDGYLPSPIVLAAAIASRTSRIRLRFALIILPLNDPIKLAEDLAVLDIVSGGRVDVVFGAGYAPHEFAMFGVDPARRAKLVTEGIEAVKAAWRGEPFTFRGRTVRVTPTPVQKPRPAIWLGGSSPAAARRAAEIADHFYSSEPGLYEHYRAEVLARGRPDPGPFKDIGTGFFVVSDDPDGEWRRLAPYIAHELSSYRKWIAASGDDNNAFAPGDLDAVRAAGAYPVLRPEDGLRYAAERGIQGDLTLHPLISGQPPEEGWRQLRYFERTVMPQLLLPA